MATPADQVSTSGSADAEELRAENARLRAERERLVQQLDAANHAGTPPAERPHRARRWIAAILVFLTAILVPVSATLLWAHRTTLNTDRYVATVAPLASDPAVTNALASKVSGEVFTALDPQPAIAAALPPKASFLAGPIASGLQSVVSSATKKVFSSQEFVQFWGTANRFAHAQLVSVLRGNSQTVITQGDMVVLNLVPVFNAVLANLSPQISGIVGRDVKLPAISGDELPSAACARISSALGRSLPETCGQVPLFPAAKLDVARQAVTRFDRLTVLALVLAPVLFVSALIVSPRRRRTLLQLVIGSAVALVVVRRFTFYLETRLTAAAKPENRDAAHAIVSQLLSRFTSVTAWMLGVALAVALLAMLTGPYHWAKALRGKARIWTATVASGTVRVASALTGRTREEQTRRWVAQHRLPLQAGGGVVFILLLLLFSVSPIWLLILAVLLGGYELGVARLAQGVAVERDEPAPTARKGPPAPRSASSPPTSSA